MKILVYDTECSGLDTKASYIQEVAWAIFEVQPTDIFGNAKESWRCVKAKSALVKWGEKHPYAVDPGALKVTGLTRDLCEQFGEEAIKILPELFLDMKECDYVGGHNVKGYDNDMFLHNNYRLFLGEDSMKLEIDEMYHSLKFVDSMIDIDYPEHCKSLTLKYLALEHGYVLTGAHEALQDIFASSHLFKSYDILKTIQNAITPVEERYLKLVFGDPKVDKLKEHRFRWNPKLKIWSKKIREDKVESLHRELGFSTDLLLTQGELL
jgi:hypothetical protein